MQLVSAFATPQVPSWEYVPLKSLLITPGVVRPQARLLCEDDEGGWMFHVLCDDAYLLHLEPYATLLREWEVDPDAVERPVVPIYWDFGGRAHFCPCGAEHDYPELQELNPAIRARRALANPGFSKRITHIAQDLRTLPADTVLNLFLKKSTRSG